MPLSLLGHEATSIDQFINKTCKGQTGFGELTQLRQLFTARFRRGLERLLNGTMVRTGQQAVCGVELGWIDKIPVAENLVTKEKGELGDAIVFSYEQHLLPSGAVHRSEARGVVLQAKIATTPGQLLQPTVPVTTTPSSRKELALMSAWPRFHLYPTANNRVATLEDVTLSPSAAPPAEGWFLAAPGERPKNASTWPSWWMAGKPLQGAQCDVTLGELLVAFLSPSPGGLDVGRRFAPDQIGAPARPASSPPDWSDLCNAVRRIAMAYEAPRSIFARPPWHIGPGLPRIHRLLGWMSDVDLLHQMLCPTYFSYEAMFGPHGYGIDDPFRSFRRGGPFVPEGEEGGMFVLSVTTTRLEEAWPRG